MSTTTGAADNPDDALRAALGSPPQPPPVGPSAPPASSGDEPDVDDEPDGADQLGDAGKQALDRMKTKWQAERTRRVAAEQAAAARADTDDAARIRREAEAAADARANARVVRAEIRAVAAGRFADPADAVVFLDPSAFDVDDEGNVDQDEIRAAIDELLTRKPHLGKPETAAQGGARAPRPDRSQGAGEPGVPTTAQQFAAAMRDRL